MSKSTGDAGPQWEGERGVYSTSQFLGAALSSILGGWLYQHVGLGGVFIACAVLCAIWLAIAVTMREPPNVTSARGIGPVYWKRWFTSVKKHCVAVQ